VALKLSADQVDDPGRVEETIRRTVKRDEALAAFHVVQQGFLLLGRDRLDVGIND
jgi:hypothetical protein